MASYLDRFQDMVDELKSYDFIEVVEYTTRPPAPAAIFKRVETALNARLVEPIHDFYGQSNGLKIRWRIKPDISDKQLEQLNETYDDYTIEIPEDDENPFAQINLIPIEQVFFHDWSEAITPLENEQFEFQGETYPHSEFAARLKPFDLFSGYWFMAFLDGRGIGNPGVMLLSNYGSEWNQSRITDFASYIEMLLANRGITESREHIYSEYRGDRKPPLTTSQGYWTKRRIPKMFRKK